ncbi:DUF6153 family protein [Streptomyces griseus]|uniref:DUF6153 family protein n=1 Tax=Streptomyces griseus TaxID=1911 RepID=UPI0020C81EC1|nr:DUF6153 family protein [Streptomyces griseus]
MSRHEPSAAPRPRAPRLGLLVFGLLVGLLGMHGLGSVPRTHAQTPTHAQAPRAHVPQLRTYAQALTALRSTSARPGAVVPGSGASHAMVLSDTPGDRGHDAGGEGGHPEHADSTCASGAVTGSPTLVGPQALAIGDVPRPQESEPFSRSGTEADRAPPSLAQLQLLRI